MAFYSTFFLSTAQQLPDGFPGWKLPLAEPVTRKSTNSFTGEEMSVTTCAPDWDDFDPNEIQIPEYNVVEIEGDYKAYLEQRIPAFVQSQPHWCSKNLTSIELDPLVAVANGTDSPSLNSALYAHPALGAAIEQFPDEFVIGLKSTDGSSLQGIAERWAASMSADEHTHSANGERINEGWTSTDAMNILQPIHALASQQTDDQSLYLLIEP